MPICQPVTARRRRVPRLDETFYGRVRPSEENKRAVNAADASYVARAGRFGTLNDRAEDLAHAGESRTLNLISRVGAGQTLDALRICGLIRPDWRVSRRTHLTYDPALSKS